MESTSIVICFTIIALSFTSSTLVTSSRRLNGTLKYADVNINIFALKGYHSLRGPKGDQGLKGERGEKGERGPVGEKGNVGVRGMPGKAIMGEPGLNGLSGSNGQKGDRGDIGLKGSKGETGSIGAKGERGSPGSKGKNGDKGSRGDRGNDGATGIKGEKGIPGPRGLKGEKDTYNPPVSSCQELKSKYPAYGSDEYRITLPSGEYKVYCEMAINGGGYTFISDVMVSRLTTSDLSVLLKDRQSVLLRISRPNGLQPYTVIKQNGNRGGLIVNINSYSGNSRPVNHNLGPFLYLSTLSNTQSHSGTTGFISNGKFIKFNSCGGTTAYFAFFSNPNEKPVSTFHKSNNFFERRGVCPEWRTSAINPSSGRRIPLRYFLFTEIHYGGCGCYTSSDRWLSAVSPALGTAIGIR